MNAPLSIDKAIGCVFDATGRVIFDPRLGEPRIRPNNARSLLEATTEDGVKVSLWYVELNGGYLQLQANRADFDSAWTEHNERARLAWLMAFVERCGIPVGSYRWGSINATYNNKDCSAELTITYGA